MTVDTEQTYQFDEISLSPVSQNVTSTKLNLFSPAVSERSVWSLKKRLVTSLTIYVSWLPQQQTTLMTTNYGNRERLICPLPSCMPDITITKYYFPT